MKTNHQTTIIANGKKIKTLADILPDKGGLDLLIIAKTPANKSVEIGHYFQGQQGTMFWNRLADYGILKVPIGEFADDFLLRNKFGITDIVKVPRDYGNEPTNLDYKDGLNRILGLINKHKPKVILFVYKRVLDKILDLSFGHKSKSRYGFNAELDKYFKSKVFVFPMPGTPCTRELAIKSMNELQNIIQNLN